MLLRFLSCAESARSTRRSLNYLFKMAVLIFVVNSKTSVAQPSPLAHRPPVKQAEYCKRYVNSETILKSIKLVTDRGNLHDVGLIEKYTNSHFDLAAAPFPGAENQLRTYRTWSMWNASIRGTITFNISTYLQMKLNNVVKLDISSATLPGLPDNIFLDCLRLRASRFETFFRSDFPVWSPGRLGGLTAVMNGQPSLSMTIYSEADIVVGIVVDENP